MWPPMEYTSAPSPGAHATEITWRDFAATTSTGGPEACMSLPSGRTISALCETPDMRMNAR